MEPLGKCGDRSWRGFPRGEGRNGPEEAKPTEIGLLRLQHVLLERLGLDVVQGSPQAEFHKFSKGCRESACPWVKRFLLDLAEKEEEDPNADIIVLVSDSESNLQTMGSEKGKGAAA